MLIVGDSIVGIIAKSWELPITKSHKFREFLGNLYGTNQLLNDCHHLGFLRHQQIGEEMFVPRAPRCRKAQVVEIFLLFVGGYAFTSANVYLYTFVCANTIIIYINICVYCLVNSVDF